MTFSLAPYVTATYTEHGVVLLDERSGRYWQMNDTGATVLRQLLGGGTVEAAIADLRHHFPEVPDEVSADVRKLLDALLTAKLVAQ